eukprot:6234771-Alexandrium_andersonii.AAC.1
MASNARAHGLGAPGGPTGPSLHAQISATTHLPRSTDRGAVPWRALLTTTPERMPRGPKHQSAGAGIRVELPEAGAQAAHHAESRSRA